MIPLAIKFEQSHRSFIYIRLMDTTIFLFFLLLLLFFLQFQIGSSLATYTPTQVSTNQVPLKSYPQPVPTTQKYSNITDLWCPQMGYGSMQGIPMVASSPVRHESPLGMNPIEVTSYQPPWKALSDFALHTDLDRMDPGAPPFQHLVSQVSERQGDREMSSSGQPGDVFSRIARRYSLTGNQEISSWLTEMCPLPGSQENFPYGQPGDVPSKQPGDFLFWIAKRFFYIGYLGNVLFRLSRRCPLPGQPEDFFPRSQENLSPGQPDDILSRIIRILYHLDSQKMSSLGLLRNFIF